jgi:hypothetical protein
MFKTKYFIRQWSREANNEAPFSVVGLTNPCFAAASQLSIFDFGAELVVMKAISHALKAGIPVKSGWRFISWYRSPIPDFFAQFCVVVLHTHFPQAGKPRRPEFDGPAEVFIPSFICERSKTSGSLDVIGQF